MLNLITLFALTAVAFGLVIGLMAVGVLLGRRAIQGSCGGLGSRQAEDGSSSCSLCSSQDAAACRDLRGGRIGPAAAAPDGNKAENCELNCEAEGCSEEQIEACNH